MEEKVIGRFPKYGFKIIAPSFCVLEEIKDLLAGVLEVADEARMKIGESVATVKELTVSAEKKLDVAEGAKSKFEKLITITKKKLDVVKEAQTKHEKLFADVKKKMIFIKEKAKTATREDELDAVEAKLEKSSATAKKLTAELGELKSKEAEIQAKLNELFAAVKEVEVTVKKITADIEKNVNVFEGFDLTETSDWRRMIKRALQRRIENFPQDQENIKIVFVEN